MTVRDGPLTTMAEDFGPNDGPKYSNCVPLCQNGRLDNKSRDLSGFILWLIISDPVNKSFFINKKNQTRSVDSNNIH
jgi:hypothetical protein